VRADAHPSGLPLLVSARDPKLSAEFDVFVQWFQNNKELFDRLVASHGAILFRGFPVKTTADFQKAIAHYPTGGLTYAGGGAPRKQLSERVFEATQAHKEWYLIPHQEMAYLANYPRLISFFCRKAPWAGGETILLDFREMEHLLPRRMWDRVKTGGVRYVRNFRNPEIQVSDARQLVHKAWTVSFETTDKDVAEQKCREIGLNYKWEESDGSLTTWFTTRGFTEHPLTGETVWFNHIGAQSLNRRILGPERWRAIVEERAPGSYLPNTTLYGDGGEIDPDDLEEVYGIFDVLAQAIRYREGDLTLVDNVFTAHGRNPYEGERDVQVALLM
jgi:alpha-ketoglutarate-dependent taurine dioxygenase